VAPADHPDEKDAVSASPLSQITTLADVGDASAVEELATEALDLGYGGAPVVRALDLRLPRGQVTAIVGPNGCGKSTLLGALARVHTPSAGAVLLDGRDLASFRPREAARRIGLLPQLAEAPDGLTVRDLVRYGRHPHQGLLRQWSPEDAAAVHRALVAADLLDLAERPLDTLSGGQRQRAWIAMVVAQETGVVLLDEPTSALDLGHQLEVLELVQELAAEGRTVVLVLHDLSTACRHADHLVAMRDGEVVAEGPPAVVVTPELVRDLYGVEAAVLHDPATGSPVVCPIRRSTSGPAARTTRAAG
jgi:iron complex transport system ATP-binding protein